MNVQDTTLNTRIKTAAKDWGIVTIDDLRTAHETGRTAQWRGVGPNSLGELDRYFEPEKPAAVDPLEQRARRICAQIAGPKVHKTYWNRPRKSLHKSDIFALDCTMAALKRHERKEPGAMPPMVLHERLEIMAVQAAAEVARHRDARLAAAALRLFQLAEITKRIAKQ